MPEFIYIHVSCYLCIGSPRWWGIELYESPECGWETVLRLTPQDLEEYGFPLCVVCPACGGDLEDTSHYAIIKSPTEKEKAESILYAEHPLTNKGLAL